MAAPLRVAVDLGAGSGRALVGRVGEDGVHYEEVHRFQYAARPHEGHLRWDYARLLGGLDEGLRKAKMAAAEHGGRLESVGVDSWAVDYGILDSEGRLLEEPIAYRDERTNGVMERVFARVPREEVFARTGIQFLQLNTLYQLFAHARSGLPRGAARLLLIPDLCHQHLCGSLVSEATNASTTQLVDARTGGWDDALFSRLDLPRGLMPEIVPAGTTLGRLREERQKALGLGPLPVIAPATHDTASAVAGTPLEPGWAFLSSGTWSLLGVEREDALLGEAVARANFTNEKGAFGTVRFLKNVMGLWLLESSRREWEAAAGGGPVLASLLERVASVSGFVGFVFPDDRRFFNPPSMITELRDALRESGQHPLQDPVLLSKVVLDSLALRYASVVEKLEALTGRPVPGVHVVGGGARNDYLNQATADATGRPVVAGPVEATAAGNLLVQAVAAGDVPSLGEGRGRLARSARLRRYEPSRSDAWKEAARIYRDLEARGA
ncbi:MAG TPA: rhamnulokinase family protein [Vicinamibacteria bacterium]